MALLGPNPEDLRKLSNEATQIVNQKFLITTASITVFGLMSTQVISTQLSAAPHDGHADVGWAAFFGPVLLNLMLGVLFFYSTILAGMLRVITTYLVETKASSWETDWARYRKLGHLGYTRAQAVVFVFLASVATAYPFAFAWLRGCELAPSSGVWAHVVVASGTLLMIVFLGLVGWPDLEAGPDQKWRELRDGKRGGATRSRGINRGFDPDEPGQ